MSYNIVLTNGHVLTTVADQTVDTTTTSLSLLGRHYADYGAVINDNAIRLLENSANGTGPLNPLIGQLWFNTTHASLNVFTGSNWVTLNTGAPNLVNVKDFGAVGDGTTDDTTAIQNAINFVQANGGIVFIPYGTYKITQTLIISRSGVRLIGAGRYATYLAFANGTNDCIIVNNGSTYIWGIEIADLQMTFSGKTGGRAIYMSYVGNTTIHDVQIVSPWDGIDLLVTNTIVISNTTISNPQHTSGYGLRWGAPSDGSARSDYLTCRDVVINCGYGGADGVRWYGLAWTFYWYGGAIQGTHYGLWITNPTESSANVPQFLESFGMTINGSSAQAVRIEGGGQFRFIDAVLKNLTGATGQGSADTNTVYMAADATYSYTNSIKFIGCRIGLCNQEAVYCAARDVQFIGCTFPSGGIASTGTYAAVHLAAPAQDIIINGCSDFEWGAQQNYKYGVQIDSGCFRYFITGNNFYADGTTAILNNSTDSDGRIAFNGSTQNAHFTPQSQPQSDTTTIGITWTAAYALAGVMLRSGPSSSFTDTTPTAAAIVAALTEPNVGASTPLIVINTSATTMTLQAGSGVTFRGNTAAGKFLISAGVTRTLWLTATSVVAGSEAVTVFG